MYYADLTPYKYGGFVTRKNVLNVGWLEKGHEFPIRDFPEKEEVLRKLKAKKAEHLYKGWHSCEFCDPYRYEKGHTYLIESHNGNGEYSVSSIPHK